MSKDNSQQCKYKYIIQDLTALDTCRPKPSGAVGKGPDTSLTFLGIAIDTVKLELWLPEEKLRRLEVLMQEWHVK